MSQKLLEIVLSAKAKTWRALDKNFSTSDATWQRTKHTVLDRDDYACRFCGFRARKWQEVHHLDDDHNNDDPANLVTACAFCHQDHHIGLAGLTNSGRLAWLPELTHVEINHLMRTRLVLEEWLKRQISSAPTPDTAGFKNAAQAFDATLSARSGLIRAEFGTDSPIALGDAIIATNASDNKDNVLANLDGIRMVPTGTLIRGDKGDTIPSMLAHWLDASGAYAGMQPSAWRVLLEDFRAKIDGL